MDSRANVRRISSPAETQDETSGLQGDTWVTVYASTPIRIKTPGNAARVANARRETVGGINITQALAQAYMPARVTDLLNDDVIEIVSGEWAGTVWRVLEATVGDQLTSRRVPVLETSRPAEWDRP